MHEWVPAFVLWGWGGGQREGLVLGWVSFGHTSSCGGGGEGIDNCVCSGGSTDAPFLAKKGIC